MAIKRKRLQSRSRTSNTKTSNKKRKQTKLANAKISKNSPAASSSLQRQYADENNRLKTINGSNECNNSMTQATDSICNSKFSQLKLMTIASGDVLRMRDSDDLWTRSRSLLRKNTNDVLKTKSQSEYHRNNFHLSLKDKWSKVMTNKISALAFSRSLKGRRHPETVCGS